MATGGFAVPLHFYGTFIVLVKSGHHDGVTLSFHEQFDKQGVGEVITGTNQLSLCGTLSVDALFFGFTKEASTAKGDHTASVTVHVSVRGKGGINPCHKLVKGVSAEVEDFVNGAMKIFQETL